MIFLKNYIKYFSLLLVLGFLPVLANAQSISLSSSKSSYEVGDSILITVSVDTGGQSINTMGGVVNFSVDTVSVSDVRYGNSVISLWVDKPTADNNIGAIKFTGGVPGGYSGSSGTIFTFIAKVKKQGSTTFSLNDVHVLANDGSGAEISGVKRPSLTIKITPASASPVSKPTSTPTPKPILQSDQISPETFVPLIGHSPSISQDAYFVSFFAVDKDSGVSKYEVQETPAGLSIFGDIFATEWKPAISPYVLKYQKWGSRVRVKAIDQSGNTVISEVYKPFSTGLFILILILSLIFVVIITRFLTIRAIINSRRSRKIL